MDIVDRYGQTNMKHMDGSEEDGWRELSTRVYTPPSPSSDSSTSSENPWNIEPLDDPLYANDGKTLLASSHSLMDIISAGIFKPWIVFDIFWEPDTRDYFFSNLIFG